MESGRRLLHRPAVRCACLDRSLAGRAGLDAHRSDGGRRPGAAAARHLRNAGGFAAGDQRRSCATTPGCNRLEHLWDGANQWWQERVVEFNLRAQLDLLRKLGIDSPSWQHLGWAFAAGIAVVDRVGEPDAAARRGAREAGPHRPRLARAPRASWRASRRRARPRRSDGIRAQGRRASRPTWRRASMRSPRSTRGCASGRDASRPGHRRLSNARSGISRCDRHAPQQHAADHEQQHQRDDRGALVVRDARRRWR